MNLGIQIKKYRNELSMSQDELAEKIFVSRQSISNWENDKTYPDFRNAEGCAYCVWIPHIYADCAHTKRYWE